MNSPLQIISSADRWDCHACGDCCKRHTVVLDADDQAKLLGQHWEQRPEFAGTPIVRKIGLVNPQVVINQRADGSCIFLQPDGKCTIHAELGEPAKPWPCQMFPFEPVPVQDRNRLYLRFNCPSVAGNKGRAVSRHLELVQRFLGRAVPENLVSPPSIVSGGKSAWNSAKSLAQQFDAIFLNHELPLVARLLAVLRMCFLVSNFKASATLAGDFATSLDTLAESAGAMGLEYLKNRAEPLPWAKTIFRQILAEYCRFHPNLGDAPDLKLRWHWFRSSIAFARWRGDVPAIHPRLPRTTFAQLEQPLGALPREVLAPIDRFFEANVQAVRYAGSARFGWSMVDGMRSLVIAYPITMMMLRWLASGRTATVDDAITAIGIVDRAHDYPWFGGWRHRQRLNLLTRDDQLERLLAWYVR